jgi:hypothetical protein
MATKGFKKDVVKGPPVESNFISNVFEPKVCYRFAVKTEKFANWQICKIDKPKISLDKCGWSWQPITMELYDPICPSVSQIVNTLMSESSTLGDITIESFGPIGDVVERWVLTNCRISNVDFGKLDWNSIQPSKVTLTVYYEDATLEF